jgi:hypothetical protein
MSLVVCRRGHKETLLFLIVSLCDPLQTTRDIIVYLSEPMQTTRDIIVSLCDPLYKQLET